MSGTTAIRRKVAETFEEDCEFQYELWLYDRGQARAKRVPTGRGTEYELVGALAVRWGRTEDEVIEAIAVRCFPTARAQGDPDAR